jgi:hypothetical protein
VPLGPSAQRVQAAGFRPAVAAGPGTRRAHQHRVRRAHPVAACRRHVARHTRRSVRPSLCPPSVSPPACPPARPSVCPSVFARLCPTVDFPRGLLQRWPPFPSSLLSLRGPELLAICLSAYGVPQDVRTYVYHVASMPLAHFVLRPDACQGSQRARVLSVCPAQRAAWSRRMSAHVRICVSVRLLLAGLSCTAVRGMVAAHVGARVVSLQPAWLEQLRASGAVSCRFRCAAQRVGPWLWLLDSHLSGAKPKRQLPSAMPQPSHLLSRDRTAF